MGRPDRNDVFIDSTVLYALLDSTHEAHDQVVAAWEGLLRCAAPLVTSSYVCAELLALAQAQLGSDKVQAFLREFKPHLKVLTVDAQLHARVLAHGKRDLRDLIPRISRALMLQFGVTNAFSLDAQSVGDRFRKVELGKRAVESSAETEPKVPSRKRASQRPPRRHGARRSARASGAAPSVASRPPPPPARSELICRKASGSWQWEVVLSAPEECEVAGVRQQGNSLLGERGEYRPKSFEGVMLVDHVDGTATEVVLCTSQAPMIFKLADRWSGVGRRVDAVSRGHFIVIAPTGWHRTGRAPVAPEATGDPGCQAHYFFRGGGPSTDAVGFAECDLALTDAGFSLTGKRVYDDSTEGGLFVGSPPELIPGRGVTWARIGEEKESGWRGENFLPAEQSLSDVLDHRQGRFFVRVYDSGTRLFDSGEFRYVEDLRDILVNGRPYARDTLLLPGSKGHAPTKVQFLGEEGFAIRPAVAPDSPHRWVAEEAAIVVEPNPDFDEVTCSITAPSASVDVVIRLPRIWWCVWSDGDELAPWSAIPLAMTRNEFRDHAKADAAIRIRLPREFNSVYVGFDHDLNRRYRSTPTEETTGVIELPLIDFVDDTPFDGWLSEDALMQVRCGFYEISPIRIVADSTPKIISFHANPAVVMTGEKVSLYWATRNVTRGLVSISPEVGTVRHSGSILVTPHETTTYELSIAVPGHRTLQECIRVTVFSPLKLGRLRAYVKHTYGRGTRPGRGFSVREIHASGLTTAAAQQVGIPIDWRRRTSYDFNIDALRRVHLRAQGRTRRTMD